jgi:hypothetical protein
MIDEPGLVPGFLFVMRHKYVAQGRINFPAA